jgi:hypothetical protein
VLCKLVLRTSVGKIQIQHLLSKGVITHFNINSFFEVTQTVDLNTNPSFRVDIKKMISLKKKYPSSGFHNGFQERPTT